MQTIVHKPFEYIYIFIICFSVNLRAQSVDCVSSGTQVDQIITDDCLLDDSERASLPIITMYVNVYFIGSGGKNFTPTGANNTPNGIDWSNQMINKANELFSNLQDKNYYGYPSIVGDSRIRFELYSEEGNPNDPYGGIFFVDSLPITNFYPNKTINVLVQDDSIITDSTTLWGQQSGTKIWMNNYYHYWTLNLPTFAGWNAARLFLHEMGHYFTLCHTFYPYNLCKNIDINVEWECNGTPDNSMVCGAGKGKCKLWESESHNIMSYSGQERDVLTPCQWKIMYRQATKSPLAVKECNSEGDLLIISPGSYVEWLDAKIITNKVIVSSTATLRINCLTQFMSDVHIEVHRGGKLIVGSEAILTNFCQGHRWGGIRVWGNATKEQPDPDSPMLSADDAGVVICKSGSKIMNANTGISTIADLPWPLSKLYYSGVIKAVGASFINCRKGIEFMKYDFVNKSSIKSCKFTADANFIKIAESSNKTGGVTIWDCDGIIFEANKFINLTDFGIMGIDFSCDITKGNIFDNVNIGVDAKSSHEGGTQINIDGSVFTNIFSNNNNHIIVNNTTFQNGLTVLNNQFTDCGNVGISIAGESQFKIQKNSFINNWFGISLSNTGVSVNNVSCNWLDNGCTGISAIGPNKSFTFFDNNFSGYDYDFELKPGNIYKYQGAPGNPAENCFSKIKQIALGVFTTSMLVPNKSSFFLYYVDENITDTTHCEYPKRKGKNNYKIEKTPNNKQGCDLDYGGYVNELPPPPYDLTGFIQYKNAVNNAYQVLVADPQNTVLDYQYHNLSYKKQGIFEAILADAIEANDTSLVHQILNEEGSLSSMHLRYGYYVRQNDYNYALRILNSLPDSTEDDYDYKYIQHVNLDRLMESESPYIPSAGVVDSLQQIINKNSLNSGMADAIGYVLGLELDNTATYPLAICDNGNNKNPVVPREINSAHTDAVNIYPNPVNDLLVIELGDNRERYDQVSILSVMASVISASELKAGTVKHEINTTRLANGIYIVVLSSSTTGTRTPGKIIVNH